METHGWDCELSWMERYLSTILVRAFENRFPVHTRCQTAMVVPCPRAVDVGDDRLTPRWYISVHCLAE